MSVTGGRSMVLTNKTDRRDITEILLKAMLNTITLTLTHLITVVFHINHILMLHKLNKQWLSECKNLTTWNICSNISLLYIASLHIYVFINAFDVFNLSQISKVHESGNFINFFHVHFISWGVLISCNNIHLVRHFILSIWVQWY